MSLQDDNIQKYIEERLEVSSYVAKLRYALESNQATIQFQQERQVDKARDKKYTNRYTVADLFPDEDPVIALKRELATLTVGEYIETVKDRRFPKRSDMRVFGKQYSDSDVYIKIRVELLNAQGTGTDNYIFVMSFHYSTEGFDDSTFPYAKK